MADTNRPSQVPTEYGGRPGLVQREEDGHTPTAAEALSIMARNDDPADPESNVLIASRFGKA